MPPGVLGTTANVASSIFSSDVGVLSMMSVDTISLYRGSKVGCPPPERREAQLPLKLSEVISSYPVPSFRPALGIHSGMPGTSCCCCLRCRLTYSNSSLMSLYCPVLVQGDVLPSHPASLLSQAIFRTLPPKPLAPSPGLRRKHMSYLRKSVVETKCSPGPAWFCLLREVFAI